MRKKIILALIVLTFFTLIGLINPVKADDVNIGYKPLIPCVRIENQSDFENYIFYLHSDGRLPAMKIILQDGCVNWYKFNNGLVQIYAIEKRDADLDRILETPYIIDGNVEEFFKSYKIYKSDNLDIKYKYREVLVYDPATSPEITFSIESISGSTVNVKLINEDSSCCDDTNNSTIYILFIAALFSISIVGVVIFIVITSRKKKGNLKNNSKK